MPTQHDTNALVQAPESKQQQVYKLIRDAILRDEFPARSRSRRSRRCWETRRGRPSNPAS